MFSHTNLIWECFRSFIGEQGKIRDGSCFFVIWYANTRMQAMFGLSSRLKLIRKVFRERCNAGLAYTEITADSSIEMAAVLICQSRKKWKNASHVSHQSLTGCREKLKSKTRWTQVCQKAATRMGFEPTRAEHIGLAVQRLNHSATLSHDVIHVDQGQVVRRLDNSIHRISVSSG